MLTFEEWRKTRLEVDSTNSEIVEIYGENTIGYQYVDSMYISCLEDGQYYLVICNYDYIDKDLHNLEKILYDEWYVPQNVPLR